MMKTIKNEIFGELYYKHGWVTRKKFNFWDREREYKIKLVTYEEEVVLKSQEEDYKYFVNNILDISKKTYIAVENYVDKNKEDIYHHILERNKKDIMNLIIPKTLFFDEEHIFGILCDCSWDEHGIGIQVLPEIEVDSQDLLL